LRTILQAVVFVVAIVLAFILGVATVITITECQPQTKIEIPKEYNISTKNIIFAYTINLADKEFKETIKQQINLFMEIVNISTMSSDTIKRKAYSEIVDKNLQYMVGDILLYRQQHKKKPKLYI